MGVRLSEQEAWAELQAAHTGIFTSLRRDGWPITVPTWFAVIGEAIYMRTPTGAKKVARVAHDQRGSFLVERGERWAELAAVMVPVSATIVDDVDEAGRAHAALSAKYEGYGVPARVPDATRKHYSGSGTIIRLDPAGPMLTWDNAKLRVRASTP